MTKSFSPQFTDKLYQALDAALQSSACPIAAFDADGTLWPGDLGESLFDYQVRNKLVELPPNPWDHYEKLKKEVSHEAAYLWLAQINRGVQLSEVKAWANKALQELHPVALFEDIQRLIEWLQGRSVKVFVVTASVKWAVEPGAALFNIPEENVIGITTAVKNGVVTDQPQGPITYRRGKVDGLLLATQGVAPLFCAGNTEGDLPLLESATHHRLVLASAPQGHKNHDTEWVMQTLAQSRGWFAHSYL